MINMTMFHIGRVESLHTPTNTASADMSTQATLEMWDGNVFTFTVDTKISKKIKEGDFVLVDYTPVPINSTNMAQKQIITKIISKEKAEKTWQLYKNFAHTRQQMASVIKEGESGYMD